MAQYIDKDALVADMENLYIEAPSFDYTKKLLDMYHKTGMVILNYG